MTDYSPYGARHFLRKLDPESASELRYRPVYLRSGQEVAKGGYADIDAFGLADVLVYRTLVLVHAPSSSRPPSLYRLVWSGRYYDVWQRPVTPATQILDHVPLGDDTQPGGVAPCSEIQDVGRLAAARNGRVIAVVRAPLTVVDLASAVLPRRWQPFYARAGGVYPLGPGTVGTQVTVTAAGAYDFWLDGSFHPRIAVSVDGQLLGTARDRLNRAGQGTPLGRTELAAGAHTISFEYGGASLRPGSAGVPFGVGPLLLSPVQATPRLTTVAPAQASSLCGRRLDWIEAVTGTP
jgi:hypothetical protein